MISKATKSLIVTVVAMLCSIGCGPDGKVDPDTTEALYVSAATGDDWTGDGTRTAPVSTIGAALVLAAGTSVEEIRIDEGLYEEPVRIDLDIELVGGFRSGDGWSRTDEAETLVRWRGTVISVTSANSVRLARMRVEGFPDAAEGASIGVFASSVGSLTLEDMDVRPVQGRDGADAAPLLTPAASGEPGGEGMNGENGPAGHVVFGGLGGAAGCGCGRGADGGDSAATAGSGRTGEWFDGMSCREGTEWISLPGNLPAGAEGASGASGSEIGSFSFEGYEPADGQAGDKGQSGEGGASAWASIPTGVFCPGDSRWAFNNSGGAGGGGGCGGDGGTGGQGGGGSIGVVALGSGLVLERVTIAAADGGAGGAGVLGQLGGSGGAAGGGGTENLFVVCTGGSPAGIITQGNEGFDGAAGGAGGLGGGGGGGPSLGVVLGMGATLEEGSDVDITTGMGGEGGQGPGSAGQVGLSLRRFDF